MQVVGQKGKKNLSILINSGSTHNFLDQEAGEKLHCAMQQVNPLKVAVANGSELISDTLCRGFRWRMQGLEFQANVLLLKLDSYDMVLGTQWLASLGDIAWNFREFSM